MEPVRLGRSEDDGDSGTPSDLDITESPGRDPGYFGTTMTRVVHGLSRLYILDSKPNRKRS